MAVSLPALSSYPMEGEPRGYGVIIINVFRNIPSHILQGTNEERENFEKLFLSIGLIPRIFEELTKGEILDQLQMISRDDKLQDHSMIAIAIRYTNYVSFHLYIRIYIYIYSRHRLIGTTPQEQNLFHRS